MGWQEIVNPKLTRRNLLGGLAASPMALYAGPVNAAGSAWYDLEFELSEDQSALTIREVKVLPTSSVELAACEVQQPGDRSARRRSARMLSLTCLEPDVCEVQADMAPDRTVYVRNVSYGLRFSKDDADRRKQATGPAGRKQKPGFVAFVFTRPYRRHLRSWVLLAPA